MNQTARSQAFHLPMPAWEDYQAAGCVFAWKINIVDSVTGKLFSFALRLNASPRLKNQQVIELAGAATELIVAVGEEVTIAASNHEAEKLGNAFLSRHSSAGRKQFVIRLMVDKNQPGLFINAAVPSPAPLPASNSLQIDRMHGYSAHCKESAANKGSA
jgi:hypothetical protein